MAGRATIGRTGDTRRSRTSSRSDSSSGALGIMTFLSGPGGRDPSEKIVRSTAVVNAAAGSAAAAGLTCWQGGRNAFLRRHLLRWTLLGLFFLVLGLADLRQRGSDSVASCRVSAEKTQQQLPQPLLLASSFLLSRLFTPAFAAAAAAVPGVVAASPRTSFPDREGRQQQEDEEPLEVDICEGRVLLPPGVQRSSRDRGDTGAAVDFSEVLVSLVTEDGTVKESEHCSPTGYFLLAMDPLPGGAGAAGHPATRRRRPMELRVSGPAGWLFEPQAHRLPRGRCEPHQEMHFYFKGFGVGGIVQAGNSSSGVSGLPVRLRRLSDAISNAQTAAALAVRSAFVSACGGAGKEAAADDGAAAAAGEGRGHRTATTAAAGAGDGSAASEGSVRNTASHEEGEEWPFLTAHTNDEGQFLFSGVRPGVLELQVFYTAAAPFDAAAFAAAAARGAAASFSSSAAAAPPPNRDDGGDAAAAPAAGATEDAFRPRVGPQAAIAVAASDPLLLRLSDSGKVYLLRRLQATAAGAAAAGTAERQNIATAVKIVSQRPRSGPPGIGQTEDAIGDTDGDAETEVELRYDQEIEAEQNKVLLQTTRFGILGRVKDAAGKPLSSPVLVGLEPLGTSCAVSSSSSSSSSFEEALFDALTLQSRDALTQSRCSAAAASSSISSCVASAPPAASSFPATASSAAALCSAAAGAKNSGRLALDYGSTAFAPQVLQHAQYAVAAPAAGGWFLFSGLPACSYRLLPATGLLLRTQQHEQSDQQQQQPDQQRQKRLLPHVRFHPAVREIQLQSFLLPLEQQQQQQPRGFAHAGSFQLESFAVTGCAGVRRAAGAEAAATGAGGGGGDEGALMSSCGSLEGVAGAKVTIRRGRAVAAAERGRGGEKPSPAGNAAEGEGSRRGDADFAETHELLGEGRTDAMGRFSVQLLDRDAGGPLLVQAEKQHYVFEPLLVKDVSWKKPEVPPLLATGVRVCGRVEEVAPHAAAATASGDVEVYVHRTSSPAPGEKEALPREKQVFHVKQGGSFCFVAAPHSVYGVAAAFPTSRQQQQVVVVAAVPVLDLVLTEKRFSVHGRVTCAPPSPSPRHPAAAPDAAADAAGADADAAAATAAQLCSATRLAVRVMRELDEADADAAAAADGAGGAGEREVEGEGRGDKGEEEAAEDNNARKRRREGEGDAPGRKRRGGRRLAEVWIENAALESRENAAPGELFFSVDGLPAGNYIFKIVESLQLLQRQEQAHQQQEQHSRRCPSLCWRQQSVEVMLPVPESEEKVTAVAPSPAASPEAAAAFPASAAAAAPPPLPPASAAALPASAATPPAPAAAAAFVHFEQSGYALCGESNTSLVAAFPPVGSALLPSAAGAGGAGPTRKFHFLSKGDFSVCLAHAAPVTYDVVASPCLRLHVTPPPPFSLPLFSWGPGGGAAAPGGRMRVHVLQRRVQAEVLLLLPSGAAEGARAALQELSFRLRVASGTAAAQHAAAVQQQQQLRPERLQQPQEKTEELAQTQSQEQQQEHGGKPGEEDTVDCTFLQLVSPTKAATGDTAPTSERSRAPHKKGEETSDESHESPFVTALYSCLFWLPVEDEASPAAAAADIAVHLVLPSAHNNFLLKQPVIHLSPTAAELPRLPNAGGAAPPRAGAPSPPPLPPPLPSRGPAAAGAAGVGFGTTCGANEAPVVARYVVEQQCVIEGAVSPPVEGVLFGFRRADTGETVSPLVRSRRDGSFSSGAIRCRSYEGALPLPRVVSVSDASRLPNDHRDQAAAVAAAAATGPTRSSTGQRRTDEEALAELLAHTTVTASLPGFLFKQEPLQQMQQQGQKQRQQKKNSPPLALLFTATKQATITARVQLQQPPKATAAADAAAPAGGAAAGGKTAATGGAPAAGGGEAAAGGDAKGLKGVLVSWSLLDDPSARAVKQLTNSEGVCVFTPPEWGSASSGPPEAPARSQASPRSTASSQQADAKLQQHRQGQRAEDKAEEEETTQQKRKVLRYRVKPLLKGYRFEPPFHTVDVPVRTAAGQEQSAKERDDGPADVVVDFYAYKVLFECSGEVQLAGETADVSSVASPSSSSSPLRKTLQALARLPLTVEARAAAAGAGQPHAEEAAVGLDGRFVIRGLRPHSTYELVLHLPSAEERDAAAAAEAAAAEAAAAKEPAAKQAAAKQAADRFSSSSLIAAAPVDGGKTTPALMYRVSPLVQRVSVADSDVTGVRFYLFPLHPEAAVLSVSITPAGTAAAAASPPALLDESLPLLEDASRLEVELLRLRPACAAWERSAAAAGTAAEDEDDTAPAAQRREERVGSERRQGEKQQKATAGGETQDSAGDAFPCSSSRGNFFRSAKLHAVGFVEMRGIPSGVYLLRLLLHPVSSAPDAKPTTAQEGHTPKPIVLLTKKLKIADPRDSSSGSSVSSRRVHVRLPSLRALTKRWRSAAAAAAAEEEEEEAADDVDFDFEDEEEEEMDGEAFGESQRQGERSRQKKKKLGSGRGWSLGRTAVLLVAFLLLLLFAGGTAALWGGSSQESNSSSSTAEKVVKCLLTGAGAAASGLWRWLGVTQEISDFCRRIHVSFSGGFSSKGGGECNLKFTLRRPNRRGDLADDAGEDSADPLNEDGDEMGETHLRKNREKDTSYHRPETPSRFSPSPTYRRSAERHRTS